MSGALASAAAAAPADGGGSPARVGLSGSADGTRRAAGSRTPPDSDASDASDDDFDLSEPEDLDVGGAAGRGGEGAPAGAEAEFSEGYPPADEAEDEDEEEGAPQATSHGAPYVPDATLFPRLAVSPALAQLVEDLEAAHAAVANAPGCAPTAAARAELLARLGVRDSWQRPNFSAQVTALLATLRELLLTNEPRALVVMPCGSGKSFVAVWTALAAHLQAGAMELVFLVPSLYLVQQLLRTFGDYRLPDARGGGDLGALLRDTWQIEVICSDASLAGGAGAAQRDAEEDALPVEQLQKDAPPGSSVDVAASVERFVQLLQARPVAGAGAGHGQKPRLIISTYHSLPQIAVRHSACLCKAAHTDADPPLFDAQEAQRLLHAMNTPHFFDLAVCDEAHHTAAGEGRPMSTAVEATRVNIVKRLFMTATPRILRRSVRKTTGASTPAEVFSMNNKNFYGRYAARCMLHAAACCLPGDLRRAATPTPRCAAYCTRWVCARPSQSACCARTNCCWLATTRCQQMSCLRNCATTCAMTRAARQMRLGCSRW